jgi:peroxiredoxin
MVETRSTMSLPLGAEAPPFALPDPEGRIWTLDAAGSPPAYLVAFLCNHCPFVKHVRHELASLVRDYQKKGVAVFGINSNDFEKHPDDSPEKMAEEAKTVGYTFPYLVDESQQIARAYRAACTPDFYVFDRNRKLVYCGQMDGSRPKNDVPVTGADLRAALDAVLSGRPVAKEQRPSIGCNIKWKPGNEPEYFSAR